MGESLFFDISKVSLTQVRDFILLQALRLLLFTRTNVGLKVEAHDTRNLFYLKEFWIELKNT
jgi:hypothetical protein